MINNTNDNIIMSTYAKFSIQSYDELVSWILRKLGYPTIQVELTPDQIESCVNDAVEVYTEYVSYDEAYLGVNLANYVEGQGVLLPESVAGIFSLHDDGIGGGINTLFSIPNQMWNAGTLSVGGGAGGAGDWLSYEIAMQGLKLTKIMLGGGYRWNFNDRSKYLTLDPDPIKQGISSDAYIALGVYTVREEDQLFGEQIVKKLALAYCKQLLGMIRSTFQNVPLLAGASVNETIGEKGDEEEEKIMEELKSMMPAAFLMG